MLACTVAAAELLERRLTCSLQLHTNRSTLSKAVVVAALEGLWRASEHVTTTSSRVRVRMCGRTCGLSLSLVAVVLSILPTGAVARRVERVVVCVCVCFAFECFLFRFFSHCVFSAALPWACSCTHATVIASHSSLSRAPAPQDQRPAEHSVCVRLSCLGGRPCATTSRPLPLFQQQRPHLPSLCTPPPSIAHAMRPLLVYEHDSESQRCMCLCKRAALRLPLSSSRCATRVAPC